MKTNKEKLKDFLNSNNVKFDVNNQGYHWVIHTPTKKINVWFNKYEDMKVKINDRQASRSIGLLGLKNTVERFLYTPFSPSEKAIEKVKNRLPAPHKCNCCGEMSVSIAQNNIIYGKNYGKYPWVYYCNSCESYVGMHPYTNIALGTLANEEMRNARKLSKEPFQYLYTEKHLSRDEAYTKLAQYMGVDKRSCHFAWFGVEECRYAWIAIKRIYEELGLDFNQIKEQGFN